MLRGLLDEGPILAQGTSLQSTSVDAVSCCVPGTLMRPQTEQKRLPVAGWPGACSGACVVHARWRPDVPVVYRV